MMDNKSRYSLCLAISRLKLQWILSIVSAGRISVLKNSYGLGRTSCTNRKEL